MLHPGPGGLDVSASVLPVVASARGTPRASKPNRFVGFSLDLYVDIRPLLVCYPHRSAFNTQTGSFYRIPADRPKSSIPGAPATVYASFSCYSRRYLFVLSANSAPGIYQMDYCRLVGSRDLFFSDLRRVCAI